MLRCELARGDARWPVTPITLEDPQRNCSPDEYTFIRTGSACQTVTQRAFLSA